MTKQMFNNRKASPAATVEAQVEKSTKEKEISMKNYTIKSQKTQTQPEFSTFKFDESEIRTLSINGEPWFIAKDVCEAVNISNYRDAIERLDEDEKDVALTDTLGGQQEMNVISESGMYTLILRCRDAVKKGSVPHRFRKWVTAEVLPQIRKTGSYTKSTTDERTGLRQAVSQLVSKKGLIYSEAYTLVHQRFNVEHIDELTPEQVGMAVEYVHKIYLEGELIIDEPKSQVLALDRQQSLRMVSMWYALYNCVELLSKLYKPLHALGSGYAPQIYGCSTEYKTILGVFKRIVEPMLVDCNVDPLEDRHYYKALKTLREYKPKGLGGLVRI